jgi:hypothetical protein
LTTLDANDMLALFMRDERPVRHLFRATIGARVAELAAAPPSPLRIYGEMVEVLAERGNFAGAHALEELWNELTTEQPFTLLCGYSSAHFGPEASTAALHAICRSHCTVQPLGTDPLGAWLAAAAQNCPPPA